MISNKVTWLMPVKNGMPYLRECLQSIYNQSYTNQEIIVWDNGSVDGSIEELHNWIPKLIPGEVIDNNPIKNLGECRAALVKKANSELIAIMDCDDINHKDRLSIQVPLILEEEKNVAVGSYINRVDKNNNFIRIEKLPKTNADILKWQLLFRCSLYQPTMLLKKSFVLKAGNYNYLSTAQDYDLWLRLIQLGKINIIERPLVNYRILNNSVSDNNRHKWDDVNKNLYIKYAHNFFNNLDEIDLLELWNKLSIHSKEFKKSKLETDFFIKCLNNFSDKNKIDINTLLSDKLILKQYFRTKKSKSIKNILYFIYFKIIKNKTVLDSIK